MYFCSEYRSWKHGTVSIQPGIHIETQKTYTVRRILDVTQDPFGAPLDTIQIIASSFIAFWKRAVDIDEKYDGCSSFLS